MPGVALEIKPRYRRQSIGMPEPLFQIAEAMYLRDREEEGAEVYGSFSAWLASLVGAEAKRRNITSRVTFDVDLLEGYGLPDRSRKETR